MMNLKRIIKRLLLGVLGLIILLLIFIVAYVSFHPKFGTDAEGDRLARMQGSNHYGEDQFVNLHAIKDTLTSDEYVQLFKKQFRGNPNRKPPGPFPLIEWTREEVENLEDSTATAIWFGHSAFYVKLNGKNLLLDPMFGDNTSPIPLSSGRRYSDKLPIAIEDLPVIDAIIFSHDHYDHLDYGSVLKLKDKTRHFYVPLGVGAHLEYWGVDPKKISEMDWYDETMLDDIRLICTPAQHFSGRAVNDQFATLWASWVIEGDQKLFFSGDSGYFDGFKTIGEKYGPFDVCMMECGQYDLMWPNIHMFPEETVQAYEDLGGNMLIPIHWGAFSLALHDWNDPILRIAAECKRRNIPLSTPIIGEEIVIGKKKVFKEWWKEVK